MAMQASIVINRPIEEVFDNATCLKSCVRWMTPMTKAEKVSDGDVGVGTIYKHKVKFMGYEVETHPTVRKYEPPHTLSFGDDTAVVPYVNTFSFEPVEGGTRFSVSVDTTPKDFINALLRPIVDKAFARQMQNDMENLKEMLEAGMPVKM